jgi:hypothetical protein
MRGSGANLVVTLGLFAPRIRDFGIARAESVWLQGYLFLALRYDIEIFLKLLYRPLATLREIGVQVVAKGRAGGD